MQDRLMKALTNPRWAMRGVWVRVKGAYYRFKLGRKRNVTIGQGFQVEGKVTIQGPGRVIIEDGVIFNHHVTPFTYSPEAVIHIKKGTTLIGTRFGCKANITIGEDCLVGDARIMDQDFHSIQPNHRDNPEFVRTSPVTIGDRVWITWGVVILKGVTIGEGSTITPNSVIVKDVPPNCVYGGNPAKLIKEIDVLP